jgi:hypothetical protein
MTTWPTTLPAPLLSSDSYQPGKSGSRFETDDGPSKQRINTTSKYSKLSFVLPCTDAQNTAFWTFYNGDGKKGGTWFDFTSPITGATVQARFFIGSEPTLQGAGFGYQQLKVTLELKE